MCHFQQGSHSPPPKGTTSAVLSWEDRKCQVTMILWGWDIIMLFLSNLRVKDKMYYFKHATLAIIIIIILSRMPFFFMLVWNKLLRAMRICMEFSHPKIYVSLFSATSNQKSHARVHETGLLFFISWELAIITLGQSYESGLLFPILKWGISLRKSCVVLEIRAGDNGLIWLWNLWEGDRTCNGVIILF